MVVPRWLQRILHRDNIPSVSNQDILSSLLGGFGDAINKRADSSSPISGEYIEAKCSRIQV